jgi:excisionase family DNA binding protein
MSAQSAEMIPIALSVTEAADLLGCSADTVRRMIDAGLLDAVQPLGKGGRVFVGRRAVEEFFDRAGRGQPSRM